MKLIYDEREQFYRDFFWSFECLSRSIFFFWHTSLNCMKSKMMTSCRWNPSQVIMRNGIIIFFPLSCSHFLWCTDTGPVLCLFTIFNLIWCITESARINVTKRIIRFICGKCNFESRGEPIRWQNTCGVICGGAWLGKLNFTIGRRSSSRKFCTC